MDDNTQITEKPAKPSGESNFRGVTVRAWLAMTLIGAVVLHSVAIMVVVFTLVLEGRVEPKDAVGMLAVTEPLYTMAGMALAYYFGQQKLQGQMNQPTKPN